MNAVRGILFTAVGMTSWLLLDSFGLAGGVVVAAAVLGAAVVIASNEVAAAISRNPTNITIYTAPTEVPDDPLHPKW